MRGRASRHAYPRLPASVTLAPMAKPIQGAITAIRIHPAALWVTAFVALLLQTFLPVRIPLARLFDFPLLVTIYFAVARRHKIFAIGLGTGVGLVQDALSSGLIGMLGMAKGLVGYLAATAAVKFELEGIFGRLALTATLVFIHGIFLAALHSLLLEPPVPFHLLELTSSTLVNAGFGLVLFLALDRLRTTP